MTIKNFAKSSKLVRKDLCEKSFVRNVLYSKPSIKPCKFWSFLIWRFFVFNNSSNDELTRMAQAADRMKRTRDGNIFSMIPFHN